MNFQIFKLDLERAEEPEIKLPTSIGLYQKKKIPPPPKKKCHLCFIDYTKAFDYVCVTTNCAKFFKRWECHLTFLLRNLYASKEATVRI